MMIKSDEYKRWINTSAYELSKLSPLFISFHTHGPKMSLQKPRHNKWSASNKWAYIDPCSDRDLQISFSSGYLVASSVTTKAGSSIYNWFHGSIIKSEAPWTLIKTTTRSNHVSWNLCEELELPSNLTYLIGMLLLFWSREQFYYKMNHYTSNQDRLHINWISGLYPINETTQKHLEQGLMWYWW
jgi:hypothetical protein